MKSTQDYKCVLSRFSPSPEDRCPLVDVGSPQGPALGKVQILWKVPADDNISDLRMKTESDVVCLSEIFVYLTSGFIS